MNYTDLRELKTRLYFTAEDVASLLQIKSESAQVLCSRYTKSGFFVRVKKNFYVLEDNWNRYENEDVLEEINNLTKRDYTVKLSMLLEEAQRLYYCNENFKILKAALQQQ
jgi:predicted transcriptional regulator of viral defense system